MALLPDAATRDTLLAAAFACGLVLAACDGQRSADEQQPASAPRADTGRAIERADPELSAVCDTLDVWLRAAMDGDPEVTHGRFVGSVRGTTRYGCRFAATDTLQPDVPQRPLDQVWERLAERGWTLEPAYTADGPEGRMAGMRRDSLLCVLQHYWDVGSDDERAEQWVTAVRYDARVECFREAPRRAPASGG